MINDKTGLGTKSREDSQVKLFPKNSKRIFNSNSRIRMPKERNFKYMNAKQSGERKRQIMQKREWQSECKNNGFVFIIFVIVLDTQTCFKSQNISKKSLTTNVSFMALACRLYQITGIVLSFHTPFPRVLTFSSTRTREEDTSDFRLANFCLTYGSQIEIVWKRDIVFFVFGL